MSVIAGSVSAPLPQLPPDPHFHAIYNSFFFALSLARQKPFAHHFLFLLCTIEREISTLKLKILSFEDLPWHAVQLILAQCAGHEICNT